MNGWQDLPWNKRILHLELSVEDKIDVTALILQMPPIDREAAVPKDKAEALASIRERLKAFGEACTEYQSVPHALEAMLQLSR